MMFKKLGVLLLSLVFFASPLSSFSNETSYIQDLEQSSQSHDSTPQSYDSEQSGAESGGSEPSVEAEVEDSGVGSGEIDGEDLSTPAVGMGLQKNGAMRTDFTNPSQASTNLNTVWVEDFEAPPPQNWSLSTAAFNDSTAKLSNYIGESPSGSKSLLQSTWGSVDECVGIRVLYDEPLPNTGTPIIGNEYYCGRITGAFNTNRTKWWNVSRSFAKALGEIGGDSDPEGNSIASYITHSNVDQENIGGFDQTAVYQTSSLNLIDQSDGWGGLPGWGDQILSRFYSASIDVASVYSSNNHPEIGVRIYPTQSNEERGLEVWPYGERLNPNVGEVYNDDLNTREDIRVGRYTSDKNSLFTRAEMSDFTLKITNDNGVSDENDFGLDNLALVDVTPILKKEYEDSFIRVLSEEDLSTRLNFTIKNTSENSEKRGWGFTEVLPDGLKVSDDAGIQINGCGEGVDVQATSGSSVIEVSQGYLEEGESNDSCFISVSVTADGPGEYTSPATGTPSTPGTNSLEGLYDQEVAEVEFWELDISLNLSIDDTSPYTEEGSVMKDFQRVKYRAEIKIPEVLGVVEGEESSTIEVVAPESFIINDSLHPDSTFVSSEITLVGTEIQLNPEDYEVSVDESSRLSYEFTESGLQKLGDVSRTSPDAELRIEIEVSVKLSVEGSIPNSLEVSVDGFQKKSDEVRSEWSTLNLLKVGKDGTLLDGAEFKIYLSKEDASSGSNAIRDGLESNLDGEINVEGLRVSDFSEDHLIEPTVKNENTNSFDLNPSYIIYWIGETVAPNGYMKLADPIPFVLRADGTVQLVKMEDGGFLGTKRREGLSSMEKRRAS